ncbi:lantibiotic dehydratase family protein [Elizabethkingia sp. M8]|uniref:lantibiotic dehydratase family protein n=1 Tax=Elizabethkingia sp. M8 TaxID=2796140 RepID=UPI001F3DC49C|nr:lantibiotic dehydratase family protein [Elizabethkingia sp. M8]
MPHFPYRFFDDYVIRTPLFSRKEFHKHANKNEISNAELKIIYNNPVFKEAISLASPYLHKQLCKWLESEKEHNFQKQQKLKNSLLKYYSRMSTRSIPFGLFTRVGLGKFNKSVSKLPDLKGNQKNIMSDLVRDTKLDMHFLVGLSQFFVKVPNIRKQLLFFPNSSIYKIRNRIRYIEYEFVNGKREYIISSAQLSQELKNVLDCSNEGKTIQELSNILINDDIPEEEAIIFINELIDNQVLVSELEPNVSGGDFLENVITSLIRIEAKNEVEVLKSIKSKLNDIDQKIGNPVSVYAEVENLIKLFNTEYDQKYLFQADLYSIDKYILSSHWKTELKQGISFLNKITSLQKDTHLRKFKNAFYERFEGKEVSLSYALDNEIGIGYRQDIITKGIHPYIEDLKVSSSEKAALKMELNLFQQVLNRKIQQNLIFGQNKIELLDEDFKDFKENWNDLPDTFSFMAEIVSVNDQEKLYLGGSGGSSAANLLARFSSEKSDVQSLAKKITEKEEELNPDYVLAEIIHLPEARIGNVIRRPILRQYEIQYLAKSILPEENQIKIDDLYISLKNDKIILRSKRLNKEIKPYLTNAHNYSSNPLPVYHFLCDLYSQDIRPGLYFDWGDLQFIYNYLPRIEYKNIILKKAWWRVTEEDIISFINIDIENDKDLLLSELKSWRIKRQIPQWVQWVQSDNKLTLNLENLNLVKIFIDTIKNEINCHRGVFIQLQW